jgi:hypothetical protein
MNNYLGRSLQPVIITDSIHHSTRFSLALYTPGNLYQFDQIGGRKVADVKREAKLQKTETGIIPTDITKTCFVANSRVFDICDYVK